MTLALALRYKPLNQIKIEKVKLHCNTTDFDSDAVKSQNTLTFDMINNSINNESRKIENQKEQKYYERYSSLNNKSISDLVKKLGQGSKPVDKADDGIQEYQRISTSKNVFEDFTLNKEEKQRSSDLRRVATSKDSANRGINVLN